MTTGQTQSGGGQVVGDHAPPNPAFHASPAVIQATGQMARPAQLTDPALDTVTETQAGAEPRLTLFAFTPGRFVAGLGQADFAVHCRAKTGPGHRSAVWALCQTLACAASRSEWPVARRGDSRRECDTR
jgi:hypothetical protein